MAVSEDGFTQDYELGVEQELWLYCRLCRRTFPVCFKPKTRSVRLKCLCGQESALGSMDVFQHQSAAEEHAAFYEKIYRSAKGALRDAGFPVPPSGKWSTVRELEQDSGFESFYNPGEDESAIADSYFEEEEEDNSPEAIEVGLADFDAQLYDAKDVLERHELLSELIEWTYVRRHLSDLAYHRFLDACRKDIELAREVVAEVRKRLKGGEKIRLSFTSFKHLLVDLEHEERYEEALEVAEHAQKLGLKTYAKRVAELRLKLSGED